ncbi:O-antigen/teichoic acid export membrane protein [Janibacter cremeus]|uniref:O-antigen/teichoic acid export membrane protein n=1 Tax=Janibacter cremeus TaxID=1285192 RepID=A0A852VPJ6_9MICO|nr:O-antigen/teichoic acid export membrane protein [Janibacter cremeus]
MKGPYPVVRDEGRSQARLAWSVIDQGLSSGSNFVLVFLLARGSSPLDFGLLMIGYSVITVAMVVSRNAFGGVLGLDLPHFNRGRARELVSRSAASVLVMSLVFGAVLASYSFLALDLHSGGMALLVLALALPVVLLQDLQRFWSVAVGRPKHAAVADSLWFGIALLGLALPVIGVLDSSAVLGSAMWVLGALLSGLLLASMGYGSRPRFGGTVAWLRADGRRVHLASESGLAAVSPLLNSSVVAALAGAPVVAAIRGSGVLFGPLNLIAATIPLAVVPEAIRMGKRRGKQMFRLLALGLVALATIWGFTLFLLPGTVGVFLLGESWPLVQSIVLITALEYAGLGLWAVARSRLRVQGRLQVAVRLRLVYSLSVLLAPILAVSVWGTSTAVASSLAIVAIVLAGACWHLARD